MRVKLVLRLLPSFLEAVLFLGLARLCILTLPFRWLAKLLGTPEKESPRVELTVEQCRRIQDVRRCVRAAAARVPWNAVCLPQSIAAKLMLARRSIPATVYFGVRRSIETNGFDAHAWVRAGLEEVVPAGPAGAFSVLLFYA